MPELPEVEAYRAVIEAAAVGHRVGDLRILHPFLLRSLEPAPQAIAGRVLAGTRRIGKRIVFDFGDAHFGVLHLMVAGRLHWLDPEAKPHKTRTMMVLSFDHGLLQLTEAGKKRRASLYLCQGEAQLAEHDPGGLEILTASYETFASRFRLENHTLKRNLSDARLFSGVGGAFADEILHMAKASPVALSQRIDDESVRRIYEASREVLDSWTRLLVDEAVELFEAKGRFPPKVTAFRPEMRVHGKYGEPCPVCKQKIQRIVYASRETNYCPQCQTKGKLLADRALSRLLGKDWPKTPEALEQRKATKALDLQPVD